MPLFSAFMSYNGQFISTYARTTKRSRQIYLVFSKPRTRLPYVWTIWNRITTIREITIGIRRWNLKEFIKRNKGERGKEEEVEHIVKQWFVNSSLFNSRHHWWFRTVEKPRTRWEDVIWRDTLQIIGNEEDVGDERKTEKNESFFWGRPVPRRRCSAVDEWMDRWISGLLRTCSIIRVGDLVEAVVT